ncbi:MAG: hypothetical protein CL483_09775 [Acidobacteria bacterium]|mgnify:FL=1|nr:hypothetical protein [Acidobacteriota bacterium]|tara:strand:+ start:3751 stop:4632 length:882 start_codon:yes stop_codon:yes gene_type:complete
MPNLDRPTRPDDDVPQLDFARYFSGRWAFSWDYPDSALGPAGSLDGTTEFKALDDGYFEAITEAMGDDGPVTIRETIGYLRDNLTIARMVNDSRGYSYLQTGTVTGDLGGVFTIRFDGAPFVHNRKTIRVRSTVRLLSPFNYRVQTTISEDSGPFLNYGNPWWKKDAPRSGGTSEPRPPAPPPTTSSDRPRSSPSNVQVVSVTGCVVETGPGAWMLTGATDPVASIANGPPTDQPHEGPTGGQGQFQLIGASEFNLPSLRNQTVLVKALLIPAEPVSRLNLTSVTTVASSCQP